MNRQVGYVFAFESVFKMVKNENNDGTDIGSSILDDNVPKAVFTSSSDRRFASSPVTK